MATAQEEALEIFKNATSNDTVEVTHLEDGGTVIKVILRKKAEEQNKWARFADDMHEESPLKGQPERVTARVQEFRHDFSFGCLPRPIIRKYIQKINAGLSAWSQALQSMKRTVSVIV